MSSIRYETDGTNIVSLANKTKCVFALWLQHWELFEQRRTIAAIVIFLIIFNHSYLSLDDVPSRRNSQETVFYQIRRLTTPSSVCADLNADKYATQWRWYWQDSFGMWRNFPLNNADVIETSAACLSDDIEAKYQVAGI